MFNVNYLLLSHIISNKLNLTATKHSISSSYCLSPFHLSSSSSHKSYIKLFIRVSLLIYIKWDFLWMPLKTPDQTLNRQLFIQGKNFFITICKYIKDNIALLSSHNTIYFYIYWDEKNYKKYFRQHWRLYCYVEIERILESLFLFLFIYARKIGWRCSSSFLIIFPLNLWKCIL